MSPIICHYHNLPSYMQSYPCVKVIEIVVIFSRFYRYMYNYGIPVICHSHIQMRHLSHPPEYPERTWYTTVHVWGCLHGAPFQWA